jgi:hypothetical protein
MDDAFFSVPTPDDDDPVAFELWFKRAIAFGVELFRLPPDAQVEHVRRLARVDPVSPVSRFLLFARVFAPDDPNLAAALCLFALVSAEQIDEASPQRTRTLVCVSARLGDFLRLANRHGEAEAAFGRAASLLESIPGDFEARALYLSLLSRLRRDQGDCAAADRLLGQAQALLGTHDLTHPSLDHSPL